MKIRITHITLIYLILLGFALVSCDSSDPSLCLGGNEPLVQRTVEVPSFTTIRTNQNIELILSQGPQNISVKASESFIDDVRVEVINGQLQLEDDSRCDFFRESAPTTIYVTAPNITHIRNASQYEVRSEGVLVYENLTLVSDNLEGAIYSIGDFRLDLDVQSFEVIAGNISSFYITGRADDAIIGIFDGLGAFHGADFLVNELRIFHRGSNTMTVHPLDAIRGPILSTGDVIAKNVPPIIEVEELFLGKLIFD